ncbi:MAG TPA: nucleotidyltransferase family protein [Tepidisphaeraceae bacterium]|jgi:hypothetical protein|nr:nucleotidyltransferase family protein [Tepidisphaeraceae bacterium]
MSAAPAAVLGNLVRPEVQLLLACARATISQENQSRVRSLIGEGIDWEYVLRIGVRNRVLPLVHRNLSSAAPNLVPSPVRERMGEICKGIAGRGMFITARAIILLRRLSEAGISAILYKGPALASLAYGHVTLREYGDVDILVRPRDARGAADVLEALGFRTDLHLSPPQERLHLALHSEFIFHHPVSHEMVELHWRLCDGFFCFRPNYQSLWQNAKQGRVLGQPVLELSPEDLVLFLCVHGAQHCWDCLEWVCSLSHVVDGNPKLDWGRLGLLARSCGASRMLLLGLSLARDLFQCALPDGMRAELDRDVSIRGLSQDVCSRLFGEGSATPHILLSHVFHLAARERLRDRIEYGLRLAFTPTPEDWKYVKGAPASFHFPLRFFRLGARALSRRWRKSPAE